MHGPLDVKFAQNTVLLL